MRKKRQPNEPASRTNEVQAVREALRGAILDDKGMPASARDVVNVLKKSAEASGAIDEKAARTVAAFSEALRRVPSEKVRNEILMRLAKAKNRESDPELGAAPSPPPFVVRGTVRRTGQFEESRALPGVLVRAFDKDLRNEGFLGEVVTDERGGYEISYTSDKFNRAEKKTADLIVRAFEQRGKKPLAVSPILFNAPPVATVDLTMIEDGRRGPSEYERYLSELTPLLQGVALADLTTDDVRFLAGETEIAALRIAFVGVAHRHSRATDVPPEAFYGLFRQDLPTNLSALLLQPPSRLQDALKKSVDESIVPHRLGKEAKKVLATLQRLMSKHVFSDSAKPDFALRRLLEAVDVAPETQEAFTRRALAHEGTAAALWDAVRRDPVFQKKGVADDIEFTLRMGLLTRDNAPLVRQLNGLRRAGTLKTARDLMKLTRSEWKTMVTASLDGTGTEIPEEVPGETKAKRLDNYVDTIVETMKRAFPTDAVAAGVARKAAVDTALTKSLLERNPGFDARTTLPENFKWGNVKSAERAKAKKSFEELRRELAMFPRLKVEEFLSAGRNAFREDLARFFDNAPGFDFRGLHIETYLAKEGDTILAGVSDRQALEENLKRFQRLFLVAPRYEHIEALMGANLHSARDIVAMPLRNFLKIVSPGVGGAADALPIRRNAEHKVAICTQMYGAAHNEFRDSPVKAIAKASTKILKEIPTLGKLFGSIDLCECEHCRSVYGPAAYFVDLLQFLRKGGSTAFTQLMMRRPDLQHIKLSCQNSDTPLPYVDLVNEILEFCALNGDPGEWKAAEAGTLAESMAHNTDQITADELSVNPQYVLEDAYDALLTKAHSFLLPFNRPVEVARIYLEHLGTSRHEVMERFQSLASPKSPSDLELDREFLKISPEEYDILVGNPGPSPQELFGYPTPGLGESWQKNLSRVPVFLRRTGMDYPDVVELLKTRFINPGQDPANLPPETVVLFSPDSVCDLSQTIIRHFGQPAGLSEAEWAKLHRFLRLWKKLGWSLREVDQTLNSLGATDIDETLLPNGETLLHNLARIQWLKAELNLPLDRLISLWASLDTFDPAFQGDTPYHKLFQNKAVINPVDDTFELITDPTTHKSNLKDPKANLSDHTAAILAALRCGADDLDLLRQATKLEEVGVLLDLETLSQLYRHALMARALKFKIRDYLSLLVLLGIDASKPLSPDAAADLVKRARGIQNSGFTVAQLNYLYRHLMYPGKSVAPPAESVVALFEQLQQDLRKILDETTLIPDPTGDILRQKLGLALDANLVEKAMGVIEGKSGMVLADQVKFIQEHFLSFLANPEAKDTLLAAGVGVEAKRAYVYVHLLAYLRAFLSRRLIMQVLADSLKLDGANAQFLLENGVRSELNPGNAAMTDFLALVGDGLAAHYFNSPVFAADDPPALSRIDPQVAFYWGDATPAVEITSSTFGARWTGLLLAQHDEDYSFYVRAKDGVRLWVDRDPALEPPQINAWKNQTDATERSSDSVALRAGQPVTIVLEYYSGAPGGMVELSWSSLSTPKAMIPQAQLYSGTTFVPVQGLLRTYGRLHKASLLVGKFKLAAEETDYLCRNGAGAMDFHFNDLPMAEDPLNVAAPTLFLEWESLRDYVILREKLPADQVRLIEVLLAASKPDAGAADAARQALADLTGWEKVDLGDLASQLGLTDASFKAASGLLRLEAAFRLARQTGVAAKKLWSWVTSWVDSTNDGKDVAREIIHTVKAKYGDEEWLIVAKRLNDVLREKQRAALVAYLLAQPYMVKQGLSDSNRLFEHFLIDVNMDACMMTSRLKQAISSVQLFIQRCLLNLENNVSPDLVDENRWKWMKNYRVWEANRKVFLYPENWIEPELRDDKTPLFRDLETQLLQDEITELTAERAFMGYLEKLDEVARLEIMAVYRQEGGAGDADTDEVHIFGRTQNDPPVYYYRRYTVRTGVWTPWEKINLDIGASEHLIPVVWNRRLYLFWAIFNEVPEKDQDMLIPTDESSEHKNWRAKDEKRLAKKKIYDDYYAALDWFIARIKDILAYFGGAPWEAWKELDRELVEELGGFWEVVWLIDPSGGLVPFVLEEATNRPAILMSPPPPPPDSAEEEPPEHDLPGPARTRWEIKLAWSEYRERWSPKKITKDALISQAVSIDNGDLHPPEIRDHIFTADMDGPRGLKIYCHFRFDLPSDTPHDETLFALGHFGTNACGNQIEVEPPSGLGEIRFTPEGTRIRCERFDQLSGNALIFYGPKLSPYTILRNTPSLYRMVHPAYSIEPSSGGVAGAIYPLAYQDSDRTYLALPIAAGERRGVDEPPIPGISGNIKFEDDLVVATSQDALNILHFGSVK